MVDATTTTTRGRETIGNPFRGKVPACVLVQIILLLLLRVYPRRGGVGFDREDLWPAESGGGVYPAVYMMYIRLELCCFGFREWFSISFHFLLSSLCPYTHIQQVLAVSSTLLLFIERLCRRISFHTDEILILNI